MAKQAIPIGLATAALLKSQLDQGKDYFDLLVPFAKRAVDQLRDDVVEPQRVQAAIQEIAALDIPIRTVIVLLDRLVKTKHLRKESGTFIRGEPRSATPTDLRPEAGLISQFSQLGQAFCDFAKARGFAIADAAVGLERLADYLETNCASVALSEDGKHGGEVRKDAIAAAAFIATALKSGGSEGESVGALLQGLILRRAVLLADLATIDRRLDGLVVYLDTPFLLGAAGLYGNLAQEASRESCHVLKSLGAIPAAFDVTVAEMRRILTVYESRIDTAAGRASLDYTPITQHLFAMRATGADVREQSALLEARLAKAGITIHATPTRIVEFVDAEAELGAALKDVRGPKHTLREDHDVDCIAAVLTLRRGANPARIEEARAVFAASGHVVFSVARWWEDTSHQGIAPIIHHNSLMTYCWIKKPVSSTTMLRTELAALCADTLKPSKEAWKAFVAQLNRMVSDGVVDSDQSAAMLIDDLAAKFVVDSEDDSALTPSSMADVIDRLRSRQKAELDAQAQELDAQAQELIAAGDAARLRWESETESLRESHSADVQAQQSDFQAQLTSVGTTLEGEKLRSQSLEQTLDRVTGLVAAVISYAITAAVVAIVVVIAVFPFLDASSLSPRMTIVAQTVTVVLAVLGGVFGFAVVPWGRSLRQAIKRRLLGKK